MFHNEKQANGEHPEAYVERKKLLYMAVGLARFHQGRYNFGVLDFKHPLVKSFIARFKTYLGGSIKNAPLDEIIN